MKKGLKFGALTLSLALVAGGLVGCKSEGPKVYKVTCEETAAYSISGIDAKGYKAGATVEFTIVPTDAVNYEAKSFTYGDTTVDNLTSNSGSFVMPSKNIVLSAVLRTRKHFVYNANKVRDGMTASFEAVNGDVPITGVTLSVDTPSIPYVIIDGKNITFMEGTSIGKEITIFAKKSSGEIVCQETVAVQRHIKGTIPSDPINAAEAKAVADALPVSTKDDKIPTEDYYYIKDVVYSSEGWSTEFSSLTFWLGSNDEFEMYGIKDESHKDDLMIGSEVFVKTKIMRFGSTAENYTTKDDASTIESLDNSVVRVVTFGWKARTVQIGHDLNPQVTLHPTVAPAPGEITYTMSKTGVFSESAGVVTGVAAGDANLIASVTVGGKQVKGSIHIYVQEGEVKGETQDNPVDAKKAYEIGNALAKDGVTDIFYYIEDYISEVKEAYDPAGYKNITCYLGEDKEFYVYRLSIADTTEGAKLEVGSKLKFGCNITKFNKTIENKYGTEVYISSDSDTVSKIEVETDSFFNGKIYIKPGTTVSLVGKSYPAALKADVSFTVLDDAGGKISYNSTEKKLSAAADTPEGEYRIDSAAGTYGHVWTLVVSAEEPKGSEKNPYTAAEALALAKALDNNEVTEYEYYVQGVVKTVDESWTDQFKNMSVTLTAGEETFGVYRFTVSKTNSSKVVVGANIVFKGYITHFHQDATETKPARDVYQITTGGSFVKVVTQAA